MIASRKKNLIITAALLAILSLVSTWYFSKETEAEKEAKSFKRLTIARGDVEISIRATGTVQPENRLEIKPPIAGRIESVLAREGQRVSRGQILAWMSSTERAAVLDAARAKGAEEVSRWEELYRATPIVSPINGTLILRSVEPGQTFTSADPILVLSDRLTVKAQVDETDLAQVKSGLTAIITLDAYPKSPIAAKVARIAFEAKAVNNVTMYEVDVTPQAPPETMRSGMTATVRFEVASKKDVLIVPNEAVRTDGRETSVMIENSKANKSSSEPQKTVIELGLSDGKVSEIISGLKEGDVVLARTLGESSSSDRASNPFMPSPPRGGRGNRR